MFKSPKNRRNTKTLIKIAEGIISSDFHRNFAYMLNYVVPNCVLVKRILQRFEFYIRLVPFWKLFTSCICLEVFRIDETSNIIKNNRKHLFLALNVLLTFSLPTCLIAQVFGLSSQNLFLILDMVLLIRSKILNCISSSCKGFFESLIKFYKNEI